MPPFWPAYCGPSASPRRPKRSSTTGVSGDGPERPPPSGRPSSAGERCRLRDVDDDALSCSRSCCRRERSDSRARSRWRSATSRPSRPSRSPPRSRSPRSRSPRSRSREGAAAADSRVLPLSRSPHEAFVDDGGGPASTGEATAPRPRIVMAAGAGESSPCSPLCRPLPRRRRRSEAAPLVSSSPLARREDASFSSLRRAWSRSRSSWRSRCRRSSSGLSGLRAGASSRAWRFTSSTGRPLRPSSRRPLRSRSRSASRRSRRSRSSATSSRRPLLRSSARASSARRGVGSSRDERRRSSSGREREADEATVSWAAGEAARLRVRDGGS